MHVYLYKFYCSSLCALLWKLYISVYIYHEIQSIHSSSLVHLSSIHGLFIASYMQSSTLGVYRYNQLPIVMEIKIACDYYRWYTV
jgi:hypothetical protein